MIGHQAVGGIFYAVEHVVQRRRDGVDVLGIDGRDEGLVQAGENLMDQLISAVFQDAYFGGRAGHPAVADAHRIRQQTRRFGDNAGLLLKQIEELLVTGQKSHKLCSVECLW